jgi:hypothetical protein
MPNVYGPFTSFNKQEIIGALKATGSRDKDILYAAKEGLLKGARQTKFNGAICMWSGIMATITILMAPIGVPLGIGGWFWRRRGTSSVEAVEAAYKEYTAGF